MPPEIQRELGLTITVDGQPIGLAEQAELAGRYASADPEAREAMGVDAKIHRVFANVVVKKKS
jgi:hypothetical protein